MAQRILQQSLIIFVALILTLTGCGGASNTPVTPPGKAPIDPSGNWTMTATDGGGKSIQLSALFSQIGANVSATNFSAFGNPSPFACVPFSAALSNGLVQNVNNFTGTVTFGNSFGAFTFNATLAPDGKSFTGTYSNMPSCTGLLLSGTLTGAEVPTTTGSWTGTLQPCSYDQSTGICTLFGATSPITAALNQDDTTGNVTGTYQTSGAAGLSSGIIAVVPPSDLLSGTRWQFTATDNNGFKFVVCGGCTPGNTGLDLQGHFVALMQGEPNPPTITYYWLTAAH